MYAKNWQNVREKSAKMSAKKSVKNVRDKLAKMFAKNLQIVSKKWVKRSARSQQNVREKLAKLSAKNWQNCPRKIGENVRENTHKFANIPV
jgi:hypothetical protein